MRLIIQVIGTLIWLPLELLVIATLLRGQYRRFPFILIFVVAEFLAVAAEIPTVWGTAHGVKGAMAQRTWLFVLNEIVLQALIYAVVISLIYQVIGRMKTRRLVAVCVVLGAIAFAAGSFLIHGGNSGVRTGTWLTPWTRDLNFCSAVLDLGLWTLLISSRDKDPRLLLLTGALGIRFTGEAIGDSIRQLAISHRNGPLALTGSTIGLAADLLCLLIWWKALSAAERKETVSHRITAQKTAQKEGSHGTAAPW